MNQQVDHLIGNLEFFLDELKRVRRIRTLLGTKCTVCGTSDRSAHIPQCTYARNNILEVANLFCEIKRHFGLYVTSDGFGTIPETQLIGELFEINLKETHHT